ncbi:MAG: hypothetical protein U0350_18230 [Caldilineaceae bacterium]
MNLQPDVVVYSSQDKPQLVVEVKNRSGASDEWARQMRRNLLAHALVPATPYFLLVLPDYIYLWRSKDLANIENPPDYKVETQVVLADYLQRLSRPLREISEYSLELLVNSWLKDIVNLPQLAQDDPAQRWLIESGLYNAIQKGSVIAEPAL